MVKSGRDTIAWLFLYHDTRGFGEELQLFQVEPSGHTQTVPSFRWIFFFPFMKENLGTFRPKGWAEWAFPEVAAVSLRHQLTWGVKAAPIGLLPPRRGQGKHWVSWGKKAAERWLLPFPKQFIWSTSTSQVAFFLSRKGGRQKQGHRQDEWSQQTVPGHAAWPGRETVASKYWWMEKTNMQVPHSQSRQSFLR